LVLLGRFLSELKASDLTIIIKQNNSTVLSGTPADILKDKNFNKYWGDPVDKLGGESHYWVVHIGYDN